MLFSYFVLAQDSIYEKVKSNIMEVRARKGCVIVITDEVSPATQLMQTPSCREHQTACTRTRHRLSDLGGVTKRFRKSILRPGRGTTSWTTSPST